MNIKFHYSYYILAISFILCGYFSNLLVFTSIIIIHEIGHVFMAFLCGYKINKITIYSYGGLVEINSKINSLNYKDFLVSIGGILFQIIYFILIFYLCKIGYVREYIFNIFLLYNNSILFFNIIPIYPLDGSKIISSLLYYFLPYNFVNKVILYLSFIILLLLFSYYQFNFSFIMIISILIYNLISYYKNIKYYFNRFLLERYLYKFKFKKSKIIDDESFMFKNKYHVFNKNNDYLTEKQYLNRKFMNKK